MSVVDEVIKILNSMKISASTAESTENSVVTMDAESIETAVSVTNRCLAVGDDEVLQVIAQKLGDFVPIIGEGENLAQVVAILEKMLYKIEEILVAKSISASFVTIIPHLSPNLACNCATNLVRTLVAEDLYCSCKKVLPEMMVALYPHVNAKLQQDLRFRFMQYADYEEEVPI
ncbi:hypothetical protein Ciccas_013403, partial [Cichlidogyrus casuarinus]